VKNKKNFGRLIWQMKKIAKSSSLIEENAWVFLKHNFICLEI